ncbi:MAG: transcriptional regulator [Oligoflexia bacterium]|nr:MAG: transcriptional regulator [Oligoflexia bacterium]
MGNNSKVNFSLTQLEYIVAVHKWGHFAKAAEACHVTQPTLSMQIQKAEESLGAVIFDRSKKPILLTEVGKRIIDQIQLVLFEAKKIEDLIADLSTGQVKGGLVLGIIPTVAPYLLPRLLPQVESLFPQIELQIKEMQTHQIIDALNTDEIDVGLLATPLKISKIFEYPIYFEPFSVLCRKDHELSHQKKIKHSALKYNDIWLLEEGHCLRNQVLDVCAIKQDKMLKRKYKFESGSLETLKNLVNSYGGYTLLPELATDSIGDNTQLIPFERPIPAREIGLVYRREHYKSELIEALADAILEGLPEHIRKIRQKDLDVLPAE